MRVSTKALHHPYFHMTFAVHLRGLECFAVMVMLLFQYPFLGPPSTRLVLALSSGSCQCQAAALQLSVHLHELEMAGLGKKRQW